MANVNAIYEVAVGGSTPIARTFELTGEIITMSKRSSCRRARPIEFLYFSVFICLLLTVTPGRVLLAQHQALSSEEVEWTWEVRPKHSDPKLPNVLLLGDSISRNYFPTVSERLTGIANVYLMASSATVGDPRLERQIAEFAAMEGVRFAVVHFNNGMHGWSYDEAEYKHAFPRFVHSVRKLVGRQGILIWATTTAVKNNLAKGPTNERIDSRNAIAISLLSSDGITIDDQHSLMLKHQDRYEDSVHFDASGAEIQGNQVVKVITNALHSAR